MVFLAGVGSMPGTVHVHDHVIAAAPLGHGLDCGPADHQIHHHHHAAQLFGHFGAFVHRFHGAGGDVQVAALDLAGDRLRLVHRVHHVQKAVTPVHEGLRIDVFIVLHEIQSALKALINHPSVIAGRQTQLGLGGGAQQGPAKLVQALALHNQAGRGTFKGLDIGHGDADVLQAGGLEWLEGKHIADQAGGHIGDRALLKQDQVIGHIRKILPGVVRDRDDFVGFGAVAVTGGQAVGPDHRPSGRGGLTGHGGGGLLGVYAILGCDAEEANGVGFLGLVVGNPVTHLLVLQYAGAVALLHVGNLAALAAVTHRCSPVCEMGIAECRKRLR